MSKKAVNKRTVVLFTRVQPKNKAWVEKNAKKAGFADAASFTDALLTSLRATKLDTYLSKVKPA